MTVLVNFTATGEILRGKSMVSSSGSADKLLPSGLKLHLHTRKEEGGWREVWTLSRTQQPELLCDEVDVVLHYINFSGRPPDVQFADDGKSITLTYKRQATGAPKPSNPAREQDRRLPPPETLRAPIMYDEESDGPLPKGLPMGAVAPGTPPKALQLGIKMGAPSPYADIEEEDDPWPRP